MDRRHHVCLSFAALLARDEDGAPPARSTPATGHCAPPRAQTSGATTLSTGSPCSTVSPSERRPLPRQPDTGAERLRTLWLAGREADRRRSSRRSPSIGASLLGRDPTPTTGLCSPRSRRRDRRRGPLARRPRHRRSTKTSGSSPSTRSKASPSPPPAPRAGPSACGSSAPPSVSATRPATDGGSASSSEPSTTARTAARRTALGDDAEPGDAEGRNLDWRDAAAYARRARGERKRPDHGWASLTPTEQQVVALRRRRPHQPADRRTAPHGPSHRQDPPRAHLHQARHPDPRRAGRRGGATNGTARLEADGRQLGGRARSALAVRGPA